MEEIKFKTKFLLKDTLRGMPVGGKITINSRTFKANTVRTSATSLKKENLSFEVSDKGLIDEVIVTRLS